MEKTAIDRLRDRIWITERCHMKSEKRNRFLEVYFHVTLALFSLSSIAISMFQSQPILGALGNITTFTAVCTLSISLLIFGFRFGELASEHRSCYLDLQRLRMSSFESEAELNKQYVDTLGYYQNHSLSDYMSVVTSNVFSSTQNMKDANGKYIELTLFTRLSYVTYWVFLRIMAISFFMAPIALALIATGVIEISLASTLETGNEI